MGRHINKWAKLNFVARHYDPYVQGHKGHNGVRQTSTWPICLCGDPYIFFLSNAGQVIRRHCSDASKH